MKITLGLDVLKGHKVETVKKEALVCALAYNVVRPGRFEPRCLKRRPKEYPLMKEPRCDLRKHLKKRRDAA